MKVFRFIFLLSLTTCIADFSLDAMKRDGDDLSGNQENKCKVEVQKEKEVQEEKQDVKEVVSSTGDFDAFGDEALVIVILGFLDQKDLLRNAAYICKKFKQLSYSALHEFRISEWRQRVLGSRRGFELNPALYSGELLSGMIARYPGVEKIRLDYCDLKNFVVCGRSVKEIVFEYCENLADSMVEILFKDCPNLEEIKFSFCKGLKNPNIFGRKIKTIEFLVLKKDIQHQVSCDAIKNMFLACPALKYIGLIPVPNSSRESIEKLRKAFPKIRIGTQFEDEAE